MDATLPYGLPKWVELTNCGYTTLDMSEYSIGNYNNGSTNLGGGASSVLAGLLDPGDSYIVAYEYPPDPPPSVFEDTYGFVPDFFIGPFFNGDDVIALFLGPATGDGSDATLLDVYGVIGVDGSGEVWEYTDGYSYRYGGASQTATFDPSEWFFGGKNSLEDPGGDDAVELELILTFTDPGTHICAAMVINEIHADPASGLAGDANGDGVRDSSDDEFVEIYNNTGGDLDLTGWEVADGYSVRHAFPGGTIVGGGCAVVVFGGGTPTGVFGGTVVQTASTGALGLNNGGDTVTLIDGDGIIVAEVTYGGEGGDNQSLTRDPDVYGDFVKHTEATGSGGTLYSPGTLVDGSPFPGCFVPPTGACCDETTGICTEGVTQEDCEAAGGTYGGDDTLCVDIICEPPPTGACCLAGFCADDLTQLACEEVGGTYQGDDSTCADPGVDCGPTPEVQINELRLDQPGGDDDEYFELVGEPGTSLDGLTYIVIGDGGGGDGTIEAVIPLTGSTIPDDGHFFAAEDDDTLGQVADLITTLNFENSDNVTHVLVAGFLGQSGDDVDPEDDCAQTVFPYFGELDRIAVIEEENPPEGTECHYGPPTVGPDGPYVPGQAYRCYPTGAWTIGGFTLGANDTPGAVNFTCGDALALDFRPGSCPNPLNRTSNGVLPMGLLGTGAFDVSEVDISSLTLSARPSMVIGVIAMSWEATASSTCR
ncbi:MAG: lamin tail domain-containing protein [Planctomycetota bacterium]